MLKVLKRIRPLFTNKFFTEYCYLHNNYLYAMYRDVQLRLRTDITFSGAVKVKDLITVLSKIKTNYTAVQDGDKITFKDENGIEYTLDKVRALDLTLLKFPDDLSNPVSVKSNGVFERIISVAENYAKKSGEQLLSDCVLIDGKVISVTNRKTILQGVNETNIGQFAIRVSLLPLFEKLSALMLSEIAINGSTAQFNYCENLSVWFSVDTSDIIHSNTVKLQKAFLAQNMNNFIELPDDVRANLNKLNQTYKSAAITLCNDRVLCQDVEITHTPFFENCIIKLRADFVHSLVKFAKYVCIKDGYIGFLSDDNKLYGLTGGIIGD